MSSQKVVAICISPQAGVKMREVPEVVAIAGAGLEGDRYCTGEGSFNRGNVGKRQVTLINSIFFEDNEFDYVDSRRNIVTSDVELMWLIGKEFKVGEAKFRGVKYCDPCIRPSKLSGKQRSFKHVFFDRGGLIAEILEGGVIKVDDPIITPPKGY